MTNGKESTTKPADDTAESAGNVAVTADADSEGDGATCATPASSSDKDEIDRAFHDVDFRVHVSMRYHQARRAWWTGLNRMSSVAAALAGSAAVISVWGNGGAPAAYVSAGAGGFAALNAALGFTDRAREHAELYRQFSAVAARMATEVAQDAATARRYQAEVLLLEASEPPTIQSLNIFCHNQECEARGHPPEAGRKLYLINRIFKSWFTAYDRFPERTPKAKS